MIPPRRFSMYSRPGCGLCEEMLAVLRTLPDAAGYAVDVIDIGTDRDAERRYGHKIPVLRFDGELVCHGHLDAEEVHKTLALYR
jgi:Ni2+-binding GTPase involved in maturation of urease and hydrogenase